MEVRNIPIPELAAAVAALPSVIREELAKGPYGDYRCRLCRALRLGGFVDEADLDAASRVVYQWHEDHEVLVTRGVTDTFVDGDPTEGQIDRVSTGLGKEASGAAVAYTYAGAISYYRLCIVYLLAGWRPEAAQVDTHDDTRTNPSPTGAASARGASGPAPSLWQIIEPYRTPGRS